MAHYKSVNNLLLEQFYWHFLVNST